MLPKKANNNKKTEIMAHDSFGNTDPQRGAKDADALQKGEKNFLDKFKGLSNALSNDENGFSNNFESSNPNFLEMVVFSIIIFDLVFGCLPDVCF